MVLCPVEREKMVRGDDAGMEEVAAPEGGSSWLIVIAVALNKMAFWGVLPCFGVLFADVLRTRPGEEGTSVASIIGIFIVSHQVVGLFCPALFRVFSLRRVGTVGGLVYFVGSLTAAFSTSVIQMIVTYGALQGVGFGLMLSASLASFNLHFRRRRTVAMALAQCINGAGSLVVPMALQALQASAGSLAAKLVFSTLSAAAAASQLLLKPPASPSSFVQQADGAQLLSPLNEASSDHEKNESPLSITNCRPGSKRTPFLQTLRAFLLRLWQLTGVRGDTVSDCRVVVTAVGCAVVNVGDINVFAMLPLHLRALGLTELQVAQTITAAGAGDFAGRALLLVVGRWMGSSNRLVYAGSSLASAASLMALSFVTMWYPLLVLAVLMGAFKGMIYVTFFLAIAEIVPAIKFPSAVAVFFLVNICCVPLPPLLGLVRDATGSFPVYFRLMAGLLALCPLSWGWQAGSAAWRTRPQRRHSAEGAGDKDGGRRRSSLSGRTQFVVNDGSV